MSEPRLLPVNMVLALVLAKLYRQEARTSVEIARLYEKMAREASASSTTEGAEK